MDLDKQLDTGLSPGTYADVPSPSSKGSSYLEKSTGASTSTSSSGARSNTLSRRQEVQQESAGVVDNSRAAHFPATSPVQILSNLESKLQVGAGSICSIPLIGAYLNSDCEL